MDLSYLRNLYRKLVRLPRAFNIALLLLITIGVIAFAVSWKNFLKSPVLSPEQHNVTYVFKPGSSIKTLAHDLHAKGAIAKPSYLVFLAYWQGVTRKLQAGEYCFVAGITPQQLLDQVVAGNVVHHEFTIVEGWNFRQLIVAMEKNPYLQRTLTGLSSEEIMNKLGHPKEDAEGKFFPETYYFAMNTKDTVLLEKAYQTMTKRLQLEWQNRGAYLPYATPYEALIVASLVEKETGRSYERPLIAGVILQRLQKNMPLQIDATIVYGLKENYAGNITKKDLQTDNPYNSYTRRGLPPTPISMPSGDSIYAALHPIRSAFLYFVARGNGEHHFSSTLLDHNKAVAHYRLRVTKKE